MFHPIQRGELTDRLRRFFGIRGSYRADVDSTVAAVAIAQDVSQPPFRQTGLRAFGGRALAPGVGNMAQVYVAPLPGVTVVVDQLILSCNAPQAVWNWAITAAGDATWVPDAPTPELIAQPTPYPPVLRPDSRVITRAETPAAGPPLAGVLGFALTANTGNPLVIPTQIVIPGAPAGTEIPALGPVGYCLKIECADSANAYVAWSGLVFEQSQL